MAKRRYNKQRVTQARKLIVEQVPITVAVSSYGIEIYKDKIVCPFHNDDNPSCMVSDEYKTYHCFGCHAKGTVVEFVRDYERLQGNDNYSQVDAIEEFAKVFRIDIPDLEDMSLIKTDEDKKMARPVDTKMVIEKKLEQVERKTRGLEDMSERLRVYAILDDYYFGKITGEEAILKIKGDK